MVGLRRAVEEQPSVALAAELRDAGELFGIVDEQCRSALPWARAELAACA